MRSYAIIPAAGLSVRMGRHKLLLQWRGATIFEHVLRAWSESRVSEVIVVVRKDDDALRRLASSFRVQIVTPDVDPPEMKASVHCGLDFIRSKWQTESNDAWLVAPADLPGLTTGAIHRVLAAHHVESRDILVPVVHGNRAHPVLFPWPLADAVPLLGESEGLNALLKRHAVRNVEMHETALLDDLDTPEDFRRWQEKDYG